MGSFKEGNVGAWHGGDPCVARRGATKEETWTSAKILDHKGSYHRRKFGILWKRKRSSADNFRRPKTLAVELSLSRSKPTTDDDSLGPQRGSSVLSCFLRRKKGLKSITIDASLVPHRDSSVLSPHRDSFDSSVLSPHRDSSDSSVLSPHRDSSYSSVLSPNRDSSDFSPLEDGSKPTTIDYSLGAHRICSVGSRLLRVKNGSNP
ncbi:hypothetical protein F2Q70_00044619 [Brassica cretica]|uniref:Uncharacterized protein n=1 Tax=Brassica cretica TaxID=69181 RepID=A0A8S9KI48_BRACR|nr:hypothetical protein F2Q70_00044619 [Brassica cretica]